MSINYNILNTISNKLNEPIVYKLILYNDLNNKSVSTLFIDTSYDNIKQLVNKAIDKFNIFECDYDLGILDFIELIDKKYVIKFMKYINNLLIPHIPNKNLYYSNKNTINDDSNENTDEDNSNEDNSNEDNSNEDNSNEDEWSSTDDLIINYKNDYEGLFLDDVLNKYSHIIDNKIIKELQIKYHKKNLIHDIYNTILKSRYLEIDNIYVDEIGYYQIYICTIKYHQFYENYNKKN